MSLPRIRALLVLLLSIAAIAAAHFWRPTEHLSDMRARMDLETAFPKAFAGWRLDDRMPVQLVSPDQQALLNKIYNQTLSRTYINAAGDRVMLSVAYGGDQSDGTRAHRPEVCYPAQGFQMVRQREGLIGLPDQQLAVRQLVARQGGRIEPISYWVIVGERVALSGTQQKVAQLGYSVRGIIPDGMLIRVSTIDQDATRAWGTQAGFVSELAAAVAPDVRARLFGVGAS
ncbi:MAG: EpsI family protein [Burkholderiales bacterium RIFCSPHIGHO2_12_FULL_69_20]|nr:MAG: EpsI family protein [Burkholderiales bacterium RIFCSPHIGHO2_12_FULL_69_20]